MAKKKAESNKSPKNPVGRPPKYDEIIGDKKLMNFLYGACLVGMTNREISKALEINEDTFYTWMKNEDGKTKEFSETIKKGRIYADAQAGKSLFQRMKGYTHKAVKHFVIDGKVETVEYKEHYPPSEAALNIFLKNRRGNRQVDPKKEPEGIAWADRHEVDHTSGGERIESGNTIDYSKLSDATLRELAAATKQEPTKKK